MATSERRVEAAVKTCKTEWALTTDGVRVSFYVVEMDTPRVMQAPVAKRHESGQWEDELGGLGPAKPGIGPRQDPVGEFPTGPAIGEIFPDIVARSHTGENVDVHADRAGRAAVFVFYRSAVW